jgi:hypothetical protein
MNTFTPIEWGTHITCERCGDKVPRGIMNYVDHQEVCTGIMTEDAEFEVIEPKQLPKPLVQ